MAVNIAALYPGRVNVPDLDYPTGSIRNETTPGISNDGTPLDDAWGNDFEGTKQALLRSGELVASGASETAIESQMIQGIIQQAAGRAYNYDDTGAANAYVLDLRSSQQGVGVLFEGLVVKFPADNANTGASTVDVSSLVGNAPGTNIFNIRLQGGVADPAVGDIAATGDTRLVYRESPAAHFELEFAASPSVGVDQTWQDVLASRAINVTYTNTTGAPIELLLSQISSGQQNIFINGTQVAQNSADTSTSNCVSIIIPDGSTYRVDSGLPTFWWELR